ncbi:MAG: hypothetical protein FGM24_06175 [Candidatus Kapabacteria bacterium]|nr:hypothetical protein [Candidatus Kapabacteria bacterium]
MTLTLDTIDIVIVAASMLLAAGVGYLVQSASVGRGSFLDVALAGRRLTMPMFVVTLVATWYGAVLSVGEFVWTHGIVVILCFGVPYYIAAVLYGLVVAPRIRNAPSVTIPEQIGRVYGPAASRIATVLVAVVTSPAPYLLMAAELLHAMTGWSILISMFIVSVVSIGYVVRGGLRSDVAANIVQLVLMYGGFVLLLIFAMQRFGGLGVLAETMAPSLLQVPGTIGWHGIAAWWAIALQTFVDPNIHQRAAAASTPSVARRGMLISVVFWMVFDLLTITTALYAVTFADVHRAVETHLVLAQLVLPPIAKGIFVGGVFAAILSTLDGYAIVQGMTIGRDIIDTLRGRSASVTSFRIGVVISALTSMLLALAIPSVIELFMTLAGLVVPGLLVPLLLSYIMPQRMQERGSALRMLVPTLIVLCMQACSVADMATSMLTALIVSVTLHGIMLWRERKMSI